MHGIQDMFGSNAKITKWTTDTDSKNVIPQTDLLAESTEENTAVLPITFLRTSQPIIRAPMGLSKQTHYLTF